ncbi:MAG: Fe-S protein assembly co-chaperone HscB [Azovibrio sp.]|nr:Fe-S protein assembly co-chaperone HscB [Azovibrio sp.]
MLDLKQDYFALFGLTPAFALEGERLESAYREIQARVHPDRHAHLSDAEKRLAMQWATHANEAFRTLRSPLLRGAYLLSLQGVDPQFETNTAMAPEFLMEQMEWREALADARAEGDEDALEDLARDLRQDARTLVAQLGDELDGRQDLAAAADTLRRLKFLDKLQNEINDALTALES